MATISNTPGSHTLLRVEARKSFVLAVQMHDWKGRYADLTGCSLRIVAKPEPVNDDSDASNFLATNSIASIPEPIKGYAVFAIQAVTLDVKPGEYPFAIVLTTADGFTSVVVKGTLEVVQNVEFSAVGTSFTLSTPTQTLNVQPTPQGVIFVEVGTQPPPGMNYVRDETVEAIESFNPDDIAYVPEGGRAGYVLTKLTGDDYAFEWRPLGNGAFALNATGVTMGHTPVALGDGTWTWQAVGIDATGVPDGLAPVANGDGTWSWAEVTQVKSDWAAAPGADGEILNKPMLGTAAAKAETDFIPSTTLVSAMPGIQFRTTVPTTADLPEGHIAFVYTA